MQHDPDLDPRLTLAGCLRRRLAALHARQGLRYLLEECLDVMSQLSAGLDKHQVVLLGFLLALLGRHLPLVVQIRLVAHQDNDDVVASLCPYVVYPLLRVLERLGICAPRN